MSSTGEFFSLIEALDEQEWVIMYAQLISSNIDPKLTRTV
jgi:hypothetical protein